MNTYFYSPATKGLYSSAISGDNLPPDAIELSDDEWASLRDGLAAQKIVAIGDDGRPKLAEQAPYVKSRDEIQADRLRAYSDPLTGSDRYFSEALRMQVMNEAGWEQVRATGVVRFKEIQEALPLGVVVPACFDG